MLAVGMVDLGGVVALIGLLSLFYPLRAIGIRTRGMGALLLAIGLAVCVVGFIWPASESRVADARSALDEHVPIYQFSERHQVHVDAPRDRVFAAIKEVTAREIALFQTLTWIRRFGRPGPESILNAPEEQPILDVAVRSGFIALAETPNREVLVGTILRVPREVRVERTAAAFRALKQPGVIKAGMNFLIEPDGSGSLVTTETRVVATDASARRAFAVYWRTIYPGSALIRRMWLRAVKRRAEAAA